jgi:hypothetical protein
MAKTSFIFGKSDFLGFALGFTKMWANTALQSSCYNQAVVSLAQWLKPLPVYPAGVRSSSGPFAIFE